MLSDLYMHFSFLMKDNASLPFASFQKHVPIWGSFNRWCDAILHNIQ